MGDITIANPPEDNEGDTAECVKAEGYNTSLLSTSYEHSGVRRRRYLIGIIFFNTIASLSSAHSFHDRKWRFTPQHPSFIGAAQRRQLPALPARVYSTELRASKVDQIIDDLKTLTLLETSELVKKIEETFGVSASMAVSAPAPAASGPVAAAAAPEEEEEEEKPKQTTFEVALIERPEDVSVRMALFRALRKILPDKPLTDVKAAIDNAPTVLKIVNKEDEAKEAIKIIEQAGGKAEIR
ncbi:hypothetical protein BgAZ_108960 [Babesia gibsoni]|uniref:Large ribosomal subunit protein bL12 oligomerization domain-containing protein n=1 Tax=Babesia gibsoni TaxID=33632 RepID=A0AAD8PGD3_BABGI|nr:hypothetical protein BgAZ_108960 [Babesia gibsoni]